MKLRKKTMALTEEDARKIELDVSGVRVPIRFSGDVKKTIGGWKVKCERCGDWIAFDNNTIETAGPVDKPNLLKEVTVGYKLVKETNKLAEDVKNGSVDWIEFLRRRHQILYDSARFPTALVGNMNLKLQCDQCGVETSVNVDVGGTIQELKNLPSNVDALIQVGITKPESKRFFQLKTSKLAERFVEAIRFSQQEVKQLDEYRKKIEHFINNLPTDSDIVAELLYDVNSAARNSVIAKTKQLEEWQKATVEEVERAMFPTPEATESTTTPSRTTPSRTLLRSYLGLPPKR